MISDSKVGGAGRVCDVSQCVLARVFELTASLDVECDVPAVLSSKFHLNLVG